MKRILLVLLFAVVALKIKAQETPPAMDANFKQLSTQQLWWDVVNGRPWLYKGSAYGWNRLARFSELTSFVPYTGATSNLNLGAWQLQASLLRSRYSSDFFAEYGAGGIQLQNGDANWYLEFPYEAAGGTFATREWSNSNLIQASPSTPQSANISLSNSSIFSIKNADGNNSILMHPGGGINLTGTGENSSAIIQAGGLVSVTSPYGGGTMYPGGFTAYYNDGASLTLNGSVLYFRDALSNGITATKDGYSLYKDLNNFNLRPNPSPISNTTNVYFPSKSDTLATISDINDRALSQVSKSGDNMSGDLILYNATPSNALSAVPKSYVDNAITGITWKNSARVATIANITLSGIQTIDGVGLVAGNRILVKNQTDQTQNGIYVVSSGTWTRPNDADSADELNTATIAITLGAINKNTQWTATSTITTIGSDNITFTQISGAGTYDAGSNLALSGNVFSTVPNPTFSTSVTSPLFIGALTGNASTATKLITPRTIWGQSYDGSANLSGALTGATTISASGSGTFGGGLNITGVSGLNGRVNIGTSSATGINLYNTLDINGSALSYANYTNATIGSDVTTGGHGYRTFLNVADAPFTMTGLYHYRATQGTKGASATVTSQSGFTVDPLTNGLTNIGFNGFVAASAQNWNLYMGGTAQNYLNGSLGIGVLNPTAKLDLNSTVSTDGAAGSILTVNSGTTNATVYGQKIIATHTTAGGSGGAAVGLDVTATKLGLGVFTNTGINTVVNTGARGSGGSVMNSYGTKTVINGSTATSSTASGQNLFGVYGEVINTTSIGETGNNYGGYFSATGNTTNTVYGGYFSGTGGATNYAAWFNAGNVRFNALTASLPLKLNASKDVVSAAIDLSGSEVTNTLTVAKGGTGVTTSTGTGSVVLSNSPALAGVPTAPNALPGTNTTQIANTAFVTNGLSTKQNTINSTGYPYYNGTTLTAINGGINDMLIGNGTFQSINPRVRAVTFTTVTPNNTSIAASDDLQTVVNKTQGQIDAKQNLITLTTNPNILTAGAATFNQNTGSLNIPAPNTNIMTANQRAMSTSQTLSVSSDYTALVSVPSSSDITITLPDAPVGQIFIVKRLNVSAGIGSVLVTAGAIDNVFSPVTISVGNKGFVFQSAGAGQYYIIGAF